MKNKPWKFSITREKIGHYQFYEKRNASMSYG